MRKERERIGLRRWLDPSDARAQSKTQRLLHRIGFLGFVAYALMSLLVGSARWFWLGEIAASFSWHLGVAGALACISLSLLRRRWLATFTVMLALVHAGPELLLHWPRTIETEPVAELEVATCNLLWKNREVSKMRDWIETADPEVLVCVEVSPTWRALLEAQEQYPFRLFSPIDEDWNAKTWGTAILSKHPLRSADLIDVGDGLGRPLMEARIAVGERELLLRGVHAMRPGKPWRTRLRNGLFHRLAELEWPVEGVLVGDLNVTSTSPMFRRVTKDLGLRDSRAGFGRQPSYTTTDILPGLSIAIDHVLVGDAVRVLERRTSRLPGSDHRAVIVRLALR